VAGYRVGGKTGTAQVYVDGVVSTDTHIGSFIGFAPVNDPQIAVLVIVEEADVAVDYGSVTAAPYAQDILEQALRYLGVAPETHDEISKVQVPDVVGQTVSEAAKSVSASGLDCVFDGEGGRVIAQLPLPGAVMNEGSIMMLYVDNLTDMRHNGKVEVPDLKGMSVLEANRLLRSYGLNMQIEGGGIAVSQQPEAGENVFPTAAVYVKFEYP